MKRIAVDMDEVLADALSEHLARYNRDHGEAITKGHLEGKWLWDVVSADRHERLEGYLRSEDFFEDLPVLEHSQEVLEKLSSTTRFSSPPPLWSSPTLSALNTGGYDGTFPLFRRPISCSAETRAFCSPTT